MDGIFTTLRVQAGRPWFWPEHAARLREGAAHLGATAPPDDELRAAVAGGVAGLADARVRITIRQDGAVAVEASPYEPPRAAWTLAPVRVHREERARRKLVSLRAAYYDPARAAAAPADDALLVTDDGAVLEAAVANVFFLLGGALVTPSGDALLPGIVRGRLLAVESGATAAPLRLDEIARATACVATNALVGVHPVAEIVGVGRYRSARLARTLMESLTEQPV